MVLVWTHFEPPVLAVYIAKELLLPLLTTIIIIKFLVEKMVGLIFSQVRYTIKELKRKGVVVNLGGKRWI